MLIICSVAAEFVNPEGDRFAVTGKDIGIIKDAPEWIRKTLLFKWMANDGSVKFVTEKNRVEAENEPLKGIDAEGKTIQKKTEKDESEPAEGKQEGAEEEPKAEPKAKAEAKPKEKARAKKEKKEEVAEEPKKDDA